MIYSDVDTTIDLFVIDDMYYQITEKAIDWESIADEILRNNYLSTLFEDPL